ncbi:MAG: DnaJ family domain-containing protein [Candidatus Limnocylindria bacterium]
MKRSTGDEREGRGDERLRRLERSVEDRLRRMSEAGELADLPGEGRRLLLEGPDGPRWAAFHLMRNNRVLPHWAQMRKEIDADAERLAAGVRRHLAWVDRRGDELRRLPAERIVHAARGTGEEEDRFRSRVQAEVRELNARIDRYNAAVPAHSLQLSPLAVDRLYASARATSVARRPGA